MNTPSPLIITLLSLSLNACVTQPISQAKAKVSTIMQQPNQDYVFDIGNHTVNLEDITMMHQEIKPKKKSREYSEFILGKDGKCKLVGLSKSSIYGLNPVNIGPYIYHVRLTSEDIILFNSEVSGKQWNINTGQCLENIKIPEDGGQVRIIENPEDMEEGF